MEVTMETEDHPNMYLVRKDGVRFSVVVIESNKIEEHLLSLSKMAPQAKWGIEPRFPLSGAD